MAMTRYRKLRVAGVLYAVLIGIPVALVVITLFFVIMPVGALVGAVLAPPVMLGYAYVDRLQRAEAKASLARGSCPRCGGSSTAFDEHWGWTCQSCMKMFTSSGNPTSTRR